MASKVFKLGHRDEEFYIDPDDYPYLNLAGGELVDRNDPNVEKYFSSPERILEKERRAKLRKEAYNFFKEGK